MSAIKTCTVEGCGNLHWAKGVCKRHYAKLRREGKIPAPLCSIAGCGKPLHGKELCVKHYRQKVRTGSPLSRL
jgi:hypothetical protein